MIRRRSPSVDPRSAKDLVDDILRRRPGYLDRWRPGPRSPGRALIEVDARYLEAVLGRLNQAPEKNKLAFLELLGIELIAARVARAPIIFQLSDQAVDTRAPAGSRVAAPPPEGASGPVVFETEEALGLMAARLEQVVSLWPGRDQWIDHTEAVLAGQPFLPFRREDLVDTPHHLYLAHDALLALAGQARVEVEFELSQPGSEHFDIVWEYWDGRQWRGFRGQRPECAELDEAKSDATAGLTRSGKLRLETLCAETAKTEVGGIEAFWIRGRLDEPLPPDPGQILPEVSRLRLSTVIERPLDVMLTNVDEEYKAPEVEQLPTLVCVLIDGDGRPIPGAFVELVGRGFPSITNPDGEVTFSGLPNNPGDYTLEISLFDTTFQHNVRYEPADTSASVLCRTLTLELGGLQPDGALADAEELDLTRPFFPFGQQPQPGSTFFVRVDEAFSKPGARIELHVRSTETPQDFFDVTVVNSAKTTLPRTITWQYWDGRQWRHLFLPVTGTDDSVESLTASGSIAFTVPDDFSPREVEGTDGYWIRTRLVSGAFGFSATVTWNKDANSFTYVVHQPPALSDFRVSYNWEQGPYHAQRVLAFNDFAYEDYTEQATWPGAPFQPYEYLSDTLPALYLGLSQKLPVDRLGFYFDVKEDKSVEGVPALEWEFFDGFVWQTLTVDDETRRLRYPGIVSFNGAREAQESGHFGRDLYWVRARQKEDGPPAEPVILSLRPNAVWASQLETTVNETIGTSNGQPGQGFSLRNAPVLEGEQVEVCELIGPRAEVEWRSLAMEVLEGDARALALLEERLAREGRESDIEVGGVRLRRDPRKRVVEVHVRWQPRPHLRASGPFDRHYVLDRGHARLRFGDGERGRIPPLGGDIVARRYQAGGGSSGNVRTGLIEQLLAGIAGVESISNARSAEGGADEETLASVSDRGPRTLRHQGRALLPGDFEVMAREASPAVAVANAHPGRDPQGRERPGWLTLTITPHSEEPRPQPSLGLRETVRRFLEARTDAALAASGQLSVVGPDYLTVDVDATVAPLVPEDAGEVVVAARDAVATFLNPLVGGPEARGWPPGRDLFLSDLCAALERTRGIDYVSQLELYLDSTLVGGSVTVPDHRVVAAGDIRIRLERG